MNFNHLKTIPDRILASLAGETYSGPRLGFLRKAAKKYEASYPTSFMASGWYIGEEVCAAFEEVMWPVTTDQLLKVFENLYVDRPESTDSW